jgi:hypothetical protein
MKIEWGQVGKHSESGRVGRIISILINVLFHLHVHCISYNYLITAHEDLSKALLLFYMLLKYVLV